MYHVPSYTKKLYRNISMSSSVYRKNDHVIKLVDSRKLMLKIPTKKNGVFLT